MAVVRVDPTRSLRGAFRVPGDKSISHRALLFGAMAEGETRVTGLLPSADVRATLGCLRALGNEIEWSEARPTEALVRGRGVESWRAPVDKLDCGNSGTTIRLLMGALAARPFGATLFGDASLSRRPMGRVSAPLREMGARISLTNGKFAPLTIEGGKLHAIAYALPVASAQLKSALLLAGLQAEGETRLTGKLASRDHTEKWLPRFGVQLDVRPDGIRIAGGQRLRSPGAMEVPGDPSSAAFLAAACLLVPGSAIAIEGVCLNPTRIGFFEVLKRMGADVKWEAASSEPEPVGRIEVRHSKLRGVDVVEEDVPEMIDELPLLGVLAAFAEGKTRVSGAEELRVKESDRIESLARNLRAMGADVETKPDGFTVRGGRTLRASRFESEGDHRIAMAFSVAALALPGPSEIADAECVDVSFPGFYDLLQEMKG